MITWVAATAFAGTVVFDVGGVQVKGDGLTVVPVGAPAVDELDAYAQVFDGILEVLLEGNDRLGGIGTVVIMPPSAARLGGTVGAGQVTEIILAPAEPEEGILEVVLNENDRAAQDGILEVTLGSEDRVTDGILEVILVNENRVADGGITITTIHPPSAAKDGGVTIVVIMPPNAKSVEEDGGLFLAGDPPAWAVELPDGATSVGVNVAGTGREGQFVFGTTTYLEARVGSFVFGTTSYRVGGGNFLYGQVVYFRLADGSVVAVSGGAGAEDGVGAIRTDFDAKSCLAGVWSAGALVHSADVPCDAVATYADSAGGVPVAIGASASVTPAGAPQLAWSWAEGVVDPSNGASWPR